MVNVDLRGIELTRDGFFPNRTGECGVTSLANLLYFQYRDIENAIKIFKEAKNHPLVGTDGAMSVTSFSPVLEDITNNKYYGITQLKGKEDGSLPINSKIEGSVDYENAKIRFNESLKKGNVQYIDAITFQTPYIILIKKPEIGEKHAFVYTGPFLINNGNVIRPFDFRNDICGAFKAFRSLK